MERPLHPGYPAAGRQYRAQVFRLLNSVCFIIGSRR